MMPSANSVRGRQALSPNAREPDDLASIERMSRERSALQRTPVPSLHGSVRLQRSALKRESQSSPQRSSQQSSSKFFATQVDDEESDEEIIQVDPVANDNDSLIDECEVKESPDVNIEHDNGYDTDLEIDDDAFINPVPEFDATGIKDYIIECNKLGVIPVSFFERHCHDKAFVMRHHGLGPLGAKAISKPLEHNTKIESLDIEGNDIEAEGCEFLCKTLKENLYITELNLSENNLGSEGARHICNTLKDHTTIREIDLSGNNFKDCDGVHFHTMLVSNSSLKQLVLRHNHFEFEGAKWLRDALMENEHLRILDLSWNHFRLRGAVMLAEMVKENYGLKYLNLMMNGLGDDGAAAMGAALKSNQCLVELNIMANRISENGAIQVAKGLLINDVLETIRIGRNPIGANGAFALLSAIGKNDNSVLSLLDMTNVIVKDEFETLHERMNDSREFYKLKVIHGGVYYQTKTLYSEADPLDDFENDPMTKLKRYAEKNKLRLVDLFRQFDKDNSWSVDREEFIAGVRSTGIDMSEAEIDKLIASLDQDGDGEIDYGELVEGDKANREKKRLAEEKAIMIEKKREEERRRVEEGYCFESDIFTPEEKIDNATLLPIDMVSAR